MIYPNGVTQAQSWNADNTLSQISHKNGATVIEQSAYGYDGLGRRKTNQETISGQTTLSYAYGYDALDRLSSVANGTAAQQESYGYDNVGNRVLKQIGSPTPTTTYAYKYDAAQQLIETHQTNLTGTMLEAYLYDNSGNQTQKCTGTGVTRASNTACTGGTVQGYVYNSFNHLSQYNGAITGNYVYDDQGRRIQKIEGGNAFNYLYDGKSIYSEYLTSSWTSPNAAYVQAGTDHPLARLTGNVGDPSATAAYYHQDGLGSVLAMTNATKAVTATERFGAFGNTISTSGTIPLYGYTGREADASGLQYFRARYYDANGRFTQRDPLGYADGINRYAYVHGNPINFNDPSGLAANWVSNRWDAGKTYFSSNPGAAADIGVGFTPAGVYADAYGAATGKTLFGGQQLSGWERGLGLIPMVSESIGVVRGANKVDNIVNAGQDLANTGSNLASVWNLNPTARGSAIESHLAQTDYKDWFNVGQLNNGKFPLVDFQSGNNLVSLKSVDTTGSTWLSRMQDHIVALGSNGSTVSGNPANMVLDLRVQPGGVQAAQSLIQFGRDNNVTVVIKEFQ